MGGGGEHGRPGLPDPAGVSRPPVHRNGLAREEGIPPYVICSNRQLAQVAHVRPTSLSKLATIEGMGKTKLERYGKALLEVVGPKKEWEREEDAGADKG